ncbi:C-type lectin domain family 4 member E-like isoform X2 [Acipenser ruthenus]|uniref:C-type lectin domain family 4 member E-like isoform X2 n=1 Tax=Acipenser ruthenus TaxID=7906 RepID=UPI002740FB8C|nr:C-type lectin domain family 4 member E-like isoform X2 [Acipenser ruthenus]
MLVTLHSATISRQSNKMFGEDIYANVSPDDQAAAKLSADMHAPPDPVPARKHGKMHAPPDPAPVRKHGKRHAPPDPVPARNHCKMHAPPDHTPARQHTDPTPLVSAAGRASSSYRQPALVLLILCCLLLAAVISLTVYHFMTKEKPEKSTSLSRNGSSSLNQLQLDKYCPLKEGTSKERVCCPEKWIQTNGKCYYFSTDTMDWQSSRDNCTSMGADLVIIESEAEQRFLLNEAKAHPGSRYWIGLTDAVTEGVWLWVDGTLLNDKAKYWYGKEPDDYKEGVDSSGQDCADLVYMSDTLKVWYDQSCTQLKMRRICETMAVIINI